MRRAKMTLAAALAAALTLGLAPAALAEAEPAGKEEVVYINLDSAGQAESVDVVNIFDLAQEGRIVDHGDYATVRNMTGTEELTLTDGTVTAQAGPGRLYYEGRLEGAAIPWNVSLRYFLDGQERPAAELAGASGELEIRLTAEKNPDCPGTFFEDYALQATLTLDGDRCQDIDAPGATAANVGGDKQLTYTVLPGMGADVTVKARVTDFELEPVAINGVRLTLDVPLEDGALRSRLSQAGSVIWSLNDGILRLESGLGTLQGQSAEITGGADGVTEALSQLQTAAEALDASDPAEAELLAQIDALAERYEALDGGLRDYTQAVGDAYDQTVQLRDDAGWLTTGAALLAVMGPSLQDEADRLGQVLDSVSGGGESVSFASAENGTVKAVQFVLRTPAIEKPAPEDPAPEPEQQDQSFWEKLTALF